jgi:UDP-N-acetyl-D-glucosamine dehydrogenase
MTILNNLKSKFDSKSGLIGVIGLGYVGLPLLLRFAESGYRVLGFDTDPQKIQMLNSGKSYIKHINASEIVKSSHGFEATSDISTLREADAIIICLPTPLGEHRDPDLSFVMNSVKSLIPFLKVGQVISLESTTFPGTTDELIKPLIESTGLKIGFDIALVYSPEREDPGNPNFSTKIIPKIVSGITDECLKIGISLYSSIVDVVVPVSSTKVAEFTKLLENIHRAVNIGLVNEMKIVADKMDIDLHEVIIAASTKPFGFVPYYPGPGLGGHCIPIDPFYLTWKAKEFGINTKFIELAGEINSSMPTWVVGKVAEALNSKLKSIKGSKILILGISYKKNIDDMRESPSVELMEILSSKGAYIDYSDPFVKKFPKMRKHSFDLKSIEITKESLANFDCVLLATDHDDFDYSLIQKYAQLIVDTRGVYLEPFLNVVKA